MSKKSAEQATESPYVWPRLAALGKAADRHYLAALFRLWDKQRAGRATADEAAHVAELKDVTDELWAKIDDARGRSDEENAELLAQITGNFFSP